VLADFITDSERRRAKSSTDNYARLLDMFRHWAGEGELVDRLSWQMLSDYHTWLSDPATGRWGKPRAHNTIVTHIALVEQVWQWAWTRQGRGVYHGVPQPDSLELREKMSAHKRAPSWDDMDGAVECANGWVRNLLFVLRCTGLRVQQALGLRWEDLRLDEEVPCLHIRPELGKSEQEKRGRWVPLAPVLVTEVAGWGQREGWLLDCSRKTRSARARDAMRAWERAGVDKALWQRRAHHAFRAGFTSGLKRLGADSEAVEYLLGHSRGIREHYVSPDDLPLVEAVGLVPAFGAAPAAGDQGRVRVVRAADFTAAQSGGR
jgi:integrase